MPTSFILTDSLTIGLLVTVIVGLFMIPKNPYAKLVGRSPELQKLLEQADTSLAHLILKIKQVPVGTSLPLGDKITAHITCNDKDYTVMFSGAVAVTAKLQQLPLTFEAVANMRAVRDFPTSFSLGMTETPDERTKH